MRLLLLPAYFTPELVADTPLDDARYEAFAKAGIEMELFTPEPTRGVSEEQKEEYRRIKKEKMYNGKMSVHRFSMMEEGKNPVFRALRYFMCFIKQYYYGRKQKGTDAIFVVSTPPIQGMLAAMLKKKLHCKYIYNLQDIFPDTLVGADLAKKDGILWKIGRVIEDYTYRHADKIVVISEDFKKNILAKGVPEDRIEVIYNWVDEKAIIPIKKEDNFLFDELCLSKDKFRIVYAGNLGNAQNLSIVVDAAERLKLTPDIEFVIFGTGGLEQSIKQEVNTKQLSNIKLFPLQPYERVPYVYSLGDCCIVTCKKGLGGSALPSKTWTILSTGRPVVANFDYGELKDIITDNECGLFSESEDLDAFVNCIMRLYNDRLYTEKLGSNGRLFIENNLSKEAAVQKYVGVIKQVVDA